MSPHTQPLRQLSFLDTLLCEAQAALNTLSDQPTHRDRPNPSAAWQTQQTEYGTHPLSEAERKHASGLMRVNHCGEICAQALYQGQALTARDSTIKQSLEHAAEEEQDHLAWCSERLQQLGSHTSRLNPLWYLGSLAIGITAGVLGDRWSLGFLAETEKQVVLHLKQHENLLPKNDIASRLIVQQMQQDEAQHATTAIDQGAAELPSWVKAWMRFNSKIMTTLAYWV